MAEFMNFFTQYSDLRAQKRVELESAGKSEKEIREEVSLIHPFMFKSAIDTADEHARNEVDPANDIDFSFDREDVLSESWSTNHPKYGGE